MEYWLGRWAVILFFSSPILKTIGMVLTFLSFSRNSMGAKWGLPVVVVLTFFTSRGHGIIQLLCIVLLVVGVILAFVPSAKASYNPKKPMGGEGELSDREFLPTFLLCFFFGTIGMHRFYVGKIGTGVLMIFTLGGLGLWAMIDTILILVGSFRDMEGRVIKYRSNQAAPPSNLGVASEIETFAALRDKGILTEEEFNKKKQDLLNK